MLCFWQQLHLSTQTNWAVEPRHVHGCSSTWRCAACTAHSMQLVSAVACLHEPQPCLPGSCLEKSIHLQAEDVACLLCSQYYTLRITLCSAGQVICQAHYPGIPLTTVRGERGLQSGCTAAENLLQPHQQHSIYSQDRHHADSGNLLQLNQHALVMPAAPAAANAIDVSSSTLASLIFLLFWKSFAGAFRY